jgi:isoamyl acetate esterase
MLASFNNTSANAAKLFVAFVLVTFLSLENMTIASTNTGIHLKDRDRVLFFGDSITEYGCQPKGYVALIESAVKQNHPNEKIEIIGAGIAGDTVADLEGRVNLDVLTRKPTIVVIYIGINDVWHGEYDPSLCTAPAIFKARLENVVARIAGSGASIVLCTPSVIGEVKSGGNPLDRQLDDVSDIVRKIAAQNHYGLCDIRKGFIDYLTTHNEKNMLRGILTVDGVHLNDDGNALVSELVLQALGERQ